MTVKFDVSLPDGRTATVREGAPSDAPGYLVAIRRIITERPRTLLVVDEELWSEAEFPSRLIPWGPTGVRLVVELNGAIVGALSIHRRSMQANRHVAEFGIFLVEEARGLGLGRRLMEIIEVWALEHGVTRIEMPVFAHNLRAQSLYRSMGYRVEGYERQAVRFPEGFVDEIRMAKLL